MALSFIVGPHQCSWPEGRPQVVLEPCAFGGGAAKGLLIPGFVTSNPAFSPTRVLKNWMLISRFNKSGFFECVSDFAKVLPSNCSMGLFCNEVKMAH